MNCSLRKDGGHTTLYMCRDYLITATLKTGRNREGNATPLALRRQRRNDFSKATLLARMINEIASAKLLMRINDRTLTKPGNDFSIAALVGMWVVVDSTAQERYARYNSREHLSMTTSLTMRVEN